MTAPSTTIPERRRYRVGRGFGQRPRYVRASSMLFARLSVWRLTGGAS